MKRGFFQNRKKKKGKVHNMWHQLVTQPMTGGTLNLIGRSDRHSDGSGTVDVVSIMDFPHHHMHYT